MNIDYYRPITKHVEESEWVTFIERKLGKKSHSRRETKWVPSVWQNLFAKCFSMEGKNNF